MRTTQEQMRVRERWHRSVRVKERAGGGREQQGSARAYAERVLSEDTQVTVV